MKADPTLTRAEPMSRFGAVNHFETHQVIADQMEALSIELRTISNASLERVPSEATLVAVAKKIHSARRKVDSIFGMVGFAVSPGWDFMLDLYTTQSSGKQVSVTSACIGAACTPTTGLRWLQALEKIQLIERKEDPADRRRTVVVLTEGAKVKIREAIAAYL